MLYIRICVLLYVCSAVYETRTYGAMRGARGVVPYIYSIPHSKQNGHAARDKFMDWVKGCHPLYAKLLELGYTPSVHDFSPKMVDYIFYYLGEPDGV